MLAVRDIKGDLPLVRGFMGPQQLILIGVLRMNFWKISKFCALWEPYHSRKKQPKFDKLSEKN